MHNIEHEIAKTFNRYTLGALLYHVFGSYLPRKEMAGQETPKYELTERGQQKYLEMIDYAARIYSATHDDQVSYPELLEIVQELSDRFELAADKDSLIPQ